MQGVVSERVGVCLELTWSCWWRPLRGEGATTSTAAAAPGSRLEGTVLTARVYGNGVTSWHLVSDASNTSYYMGPTQ